MALTDNGSNGNGFYMPVAPAAYGGYGNGGFGFGGDFAWLILGMLFGGGWGGGFGGWGGMGGFGNMMLGYDFPWILNGQNNLSGQMSNGFQNAQLADGITSIRDGISGLSTQLCGCCSDMQMALANGFRDVSAQMYNSDMAALNRSFAEQTANMQGFNGVNGGLADLKYTLASEACATRANNTANTQLVLDKLCQLELDGYKRENDQLRSQLQFANMQASQVEQTAQLRTSQATVANQLISELRSCPIPAQPVYGSQPIFTCNNGNSCGCACNGGF